MTCEHQKRITAFVRNVADGKREIVRQEVCDTCRTMRVVDRSIGIEPELRRGPQFGYSVIWKAAP